MIFMSLVQIKTRQQAISKMAGLDSYLQYLFKKVVAETYSNAKDEKIDININYP